MAGLLFADKQISASPSDAPATGACVDSERPGVAGCPPGFAAGTRIATPNGGVPVENLAAGDRVTTLNGTARPVRRIALHMIDPANHASTETISPVRIRARAFAGGMPIRDTIVSPTLGIWREGRLLPAHRLVNGSSVVHDTQGQPVIYYTIALDSDDIVLAEGLPAESRADPEHQAPADVADIVARHIAGLNAMEPGLHLTCGTRILRPVYVRDTRTSFLLPGTTEELRIHAATRVAIHSIAFRQNADITPIPMDHPQLTDGWSAWERDARSIWRWIEGAALLVPPVTGRAILDIGVR